MVQAWSLLGHQRQFLVRSGSLFYVFGVNSTWGHSRGYKSGWNHGCQPQKLGYNPYKYSYISTCKWNCTSNYVSVAEFPLCLVQYLMFSPALGGAMICLSCCDTLANFFGATILSEHQSLESSSQLPRFKLSCLITQTNLFCICCCDCFIWRFHEHGDTLTHPF